MGKVVVTIIILSANTASCLIYTSRYSLGYTSMITDFVLMVLINGYYRFAVDRCRNINPIPWVKPNVCYCDIIAAVNSIGYPSGCWGNSIWSDRYSIRDINDCKFGTKLKSTFSNGGNAARDSYACKFWIAIKSILFNDSNPVRDSVAAGFPEWIIISVVLSLLNSTPLSEQ